jgi:TRAP-type mannitol/chloroaromatic compound transport system substrate-binding protein
MSNHPEEDILDRRSFVTKAGLGAVAAATATTSTQAVAQAPAAGAPTVSWRMTSSFPKSLDTIFGAAEVIAKRVAAATGGKFQIATFAAGG